MKPSCTSVHDFFYLEGCHDECDVCGLSWWVFCILCLGCHDESFVWCVWAVMMSLLYDVRAVMMSLLGSHDDACVQSWWVFWAVMMSLLGCHDETFGLSWGYLWAVMRILVGCHDDACHDDNGMMMMMMMTMGMRGDYDNCGGWWCPLRFGLIMTLLSMVGSPGANGGGGGGQI